MKICDTTKECKSGKCLHAKPHNESKYCSDEITQCGFSCEARCIEFHEKVKALNEKEMD